MEKGSPMGHCLILVGSALSLVRAHGMDRKLSEKGVATEVNVQQSSCVGALAVAANRFVPLSLAA